MSDLAFKPDTNNAPGGPTARLGTYRSPTQESRLKILISNLRDFLFERPIKIRGGRGSFFADSTFGAGISENLNEFFKPTPRAGRSRLLITWGTGFGDFWQNLRDLIAPPKLPPLELTSEPVDVPDIWSKNTQFTRVQALSIAFHVLVLALIVAPFLGMIYSPNTTKASAPTITQLTDVSPYLAKLQPSTKKAGGGGGANDLAPVSKGRAPKFSYTQIARPMVQTPVNPKFPMQPTVLGNPAITPPNIQANNWGDPLSKLMTMSNGQGSGTGLGNGNGGGLGPGQEYGIGGGLPNAGDGGFGEPVCIYCPKPDFTDEAVKAKYQGTVLLSAVVTTDGRATQITVVKGLGLGLDEKAVEALKNYRLKPALGPDGKPATVKALFEMEFRLY